MGGVLPCGPDPRDAVTPFEGKEPGCSSAAVDQCHQQTSVALKIACAVLMNPGVCFGDGFV